MWSHYNYAPIVKNEFDTFETCQIHQKTPKYTLKQEEKAKKLSRKLVNQLYRENYSIIMDDEKYFTFSCNNMPGNDGYYTNDKQLMFGSKVKKNFLRKSSSGLLFQRRVYRNHWYVELSQNPSIKSFIEKNVWRNECSRASTSFTDRIAFFGQI